MFLSDYRKTLYTGWSGAVFIALMLVGLLIAFIPTDNSFIRSFWMYAYFPAMLVLCTIILPLEVKRRSKKGISSAR